MELNYHNILLKISNLITVSSYLIGTFIFTLFTLSDRLNDEIVMLGLFYVVIAVLVNIIVFVVSLISALFVADSDLKKQYWIAITFQLVNIPITIAYFYYVMQAQRLFY